MILGIPWLHSLGKYSQDFQTRELKFTIDKRKIVLKAWKNDPLKVVTAKRSEALCAHFEVVPEVCHYDKIHSHVGSTLSNFNEELMNVGIRVVQWTLNKNKRHDLDFGSLIQMII